MLRDLAAFYKAETMGLTPDLPELRIQFSDYMAWLRDQEAATGEFAEQRAWWRDQIFSRTSGDHLDTSTTNAIAALGNDKVSLLHSDCKTSL